MVDVSIIIVSYNTKEFIRECLISIAENTSKKIPYEIIIVDNNSEDNSNEIINKQFPHVTLIKNNENIGFSKACNVGVKKATGRYLLFLNPDTLLYRHTLDEMLSFMDFHKEAGAATCFVEWPNKSLDDGSHRGFPTPWNSFCYFSGLAKLFPGSLFFNGYNLGFHDLDKIHEIDALTGAFMMVRREAGEDVGWWDEDYFFNGEDLDFCYKLKEKNWKIYFVPTVKILHYKGVSSGLKEISKHITTADKNVKRNITKARFDAMRIFYRKHYLKKYPGFITWIVLRGIDIKERISMRNVS